MVGVGAGVGLLGAVGDVWGVDNEETASLQLVSFAAAATLGPLDRARAMMMKDTTQRLEFAREMLSEQQGLLTEWLESETTRRR